jgi:hypothetical protein
VSKSTGLSAFGCSFTRVLVVLSYLTSRFEDLGLSKLALRMESSVVVLLLNSASRLRPNPSLPDRPMEFHAKVAALLGTGRSVLEDEDIGGDRSLVFFSPLPDLRVVSMVRPFSGLGLLDVFFVCGAKASLVILAVLDELVIVDGLEALFPTTARSELFFDRIVGRCGSGGPGRDKSG